MKILDLGRIDYQKAWALQKELLEQRALGEIEDTLLLVEHDPVYTVGRALTGSAPEVRIPKLGTVPVVEIERGGKLTFHGPGQLVGYPIFHLTHRDLRQYLRDMEHILMGTLNEEVLLPAKPCPETLVLDPGQIQTGVWVRDRKIASIGIAVKKWITYHGFALNLTTDLRYFQAVDPCGFNGSVMTSMQEELQLLPDSSSHDLNSLTTKVKTSLIQKFSNLSAEYQKSFGQRNLSKLGISLPELSSSTEIL